MKKLVLLAIFNISCLKATAGETGLRPAYPTYYSYADVNDRATSDRLAYLDSNREVLISAAAGVNICSFSTKFTFENADGVPVDVESVRITEIDFGVISVISGVTTHHLNHISMMLSKFNPESDPAFPNIFMNDSAGNTVSTAGNACSTLVTGPIRYIYFTDQRVQLGTPTPFPKLASVGDSYNLYRNFRIEYVKGGVTYTSNLDANASVQVVSSIAAFPPSTTPAPAGELRMEGPVHTTDNLQPAMKVTVWGLDESWPYNTTFEKSTDLVVWTDVTALTNGKNPDGSWYFTVQKSDQRMFFRFTRPKPYLWLVGP